MTAFLVGIVKTDQLTTELAQFSFIHEVHKVRTVFGDIFLICEIHKQGTLVIRDRNRIGVYYLYLDLFLNAVPRRIYRLFYCHYITSLN